MFIFYSQVRLYKCIILHEPLHDGNILKYYMSVSLYKLYN